MSARSRRLARWALAIAAALLLATLALGTWLVRSDAGRDAVLAQVQQRLPPGALAWERAEGPLLGPLVLHGVRWRQPDGLEVDAARVRLDLALRPLVGHTLRLDAADAEGVRVRLAPVDPDAPVEATPWHQALPTLALPLGVEVPALRVRALAIEDAAGAPLLAVATLDAGVVLREGALAIDGLSLDSDRGALALDATYRPAERFRTTLAGTLTLPAAEGAAPLPLALQAEGDLDRATLALRGDGLTLDATIDAPTADAPRWVLGVDAPALDLARLGLDAAGAPALALRLQVEGEGARAALEGEIERDGLALGIAPSTLAWAEGRLEAAPLVLRAFEGETRIEGVLDTAGEAPRVDLRATLAGLRWREAPEAPAVQADGGIALAGPLAGWTLAGTLDLARGVDRAQAVLEGRGDADQLTLDALRLDTPAGRAEGRARVAWAPALAWEASLALEGVDPGWLLPGWDGALRGRVDTRGGVDTAGALAWRVEAPALAGTLRARTLAAALTLDADAAGLAVDADLRLGESHVLAEGRVDAARIDLRARLQPLVLPDLLPGTSGRVEGTLALAGDPARPSLEAELRGEALSLEGIEAATLALAGHLPARGDDGALRIDATGVRAAGLAIDTLEARVSGSSAAPALEASARGPDGVLALALDARQQAGGAWAGTLRRLSLALEGVPALALEAPADFTLAPAATPLRATLDEACLAGPGAGRLCLAARLPGALEARLADVPLALARPWLVVDGLPLDASGTLAGEADLALDAAGRWSGRAALRASAGRLALAADADADDDANDAAIDDATDQVLLAWTGLDARATLDAGALAAEATLALAGEGRIAARLDAGAGDAGALDGALELDVHDLVFLELLSVDVARPRGRLLGTLTLGGTRAQPVPGGDARLLDFAADLPALGITLTEGALWLRQDANGGATLGGSVRSGEGTLSVEGLLDPAGDAPLSLQVSGREFLAADTAELRAVISPELQLSLGDGRLRVRGTVDVPRADIDIEGLQGGVAASPDVVVLDEPAVEAGGPALDVDVRIALGEDVALRGFGLDGTLSGGLRVRQRPGREALATGTIEVAGEYAAYGSALEITRARLGWANAPLDNPTLDITATRAFEEQRVGVRVRGTAARAEVAITSDPVIDQTEALSWLVLGRPLASASGADGERLGAAALALGGAGNLVAQRIGERLGFDQAGISDSRALGGATFTVGKYLSPRLLLSYGVSLLGTGQVVTLTYTLARGFDVQVESGVETSASINWRRER